MDFAEKERQPRGRLSVRRALILVHVKSTLERSDIHTDRNQPPGGSPRPVMERRHMFGNRLRWAAAVVRAEKDRRRNRQEKLF